MQSSHNVVGRKINLHKFNNSNVHNSSLQSNLHATSVTS